jgi:hypothetical protein
MKSPRFDTRSTSLRRLFSPANLERIWRKKVRIALKQQAVTDGIEYFDFHLQCQTECRKLSAAILAGDYVPSRPLRVLSEKSKGLCRQIVVPNVLDAIVLQCLSDALYKEIKDKAPTDKAFFEPQDHRFSQNKERDEYGTFAAWLNFQAALFKFSRERDFIIVTDVANYYDSISYVHLRNVISSISSVDECVLDMLIYILSHLLWQPDYTPRVEIGLPQMNHDAPRLLAHCLLYELDRFLASQTDHDFTRFMDDIDIGVNSLETARKTLCSVDLVLQTRQLRLNTGKTRILTRLEAEEHFRIQDNARLDELSDEIDKAIDTGSDVSHFRTALTTEVRNGLSNAKFDGGNGDKILKRLLGLSAKVEAKIGTSALNEIIRNKPGVRGRALRYISTTGATPARLKMLADSVHSGYFPDDTSLMDICDAVIDSRMSNKNGRDVEIRRLADALSSNGNVGLYCRLWLHSRFSSPEVLFETIRSTRNQWTPHEHLGRLVGSMAPLFTGAIWEDYVALLVRSRSAGFRATYKFHNELATMKKPFNDMFPALRAANPSSANGVTHSKFLCLLSALKNGEATAQQRRQLCVANRRVKDDAYYRSTIGACGVDWVQA